MITAWRILKAKHQEHAFDGEGARRAGGRWNSRGVPVVYCSAHVSLAALELLTQLQAVGPLSAYVVIPVRFAERFVESVDIEALPADWGAYPAPPSLRALGDTWATRLRSVVLRVPSVVVPHEANYLMNPLHSDFKLLELGNPKPFAFDVRLLQS